MSDFADLIPQQAVAFETDPEGRAILLRPKFISPRLQWLQRMMWKPFFRVKLDEVGTLVWGLCDGTRTVGEIYGEVRTAFGERVEPVETRTEALLRQLADGCFLRLVEQ